MSMNKPVPGRDGGRYVPFEERTGEARGPDILPRPRVKKLISSRLSAALLAAVMLFTFASCGDGGTAEPAGTTPAAVSTETAEAAKTDAFSADIAKNDYNGQTFRMMGRNDGDITDLQAYELSAEAENGDVINDAVYARNRKVEEYLNVSVETGRFDRDNQVAQIKNSVLTGDGTWDFAWGFVGSMSGLAVGGFLANLREIGTLSLDAPWWNQTVVRNLDINGVLPLALNDIPFSSLMLIHCLFMNDRIAEDYGLNGTSGIYGEVRSGGWTMDRLIALTADTQRDINGDGAFDGSDFYGFLASYGEIGIFSTACGVELMKIAPDNTVTLNVMTDKMQSVVDKTYRLAYENGSSRIVANSEEKALAAMFKSGQSLFYAGFLSDPLQNFRDMEDDYALIPFPKYDEAQEQYATSVSGGNGMIGIPMVVKDPSFAGAVTDALACESWLSIRPAVYETVISDKLLRDADSIEMFDIILNGVHADIGFLYASQGFGRTLRDLMQSKTTDLASYYASREAAALAYYEEVIGAYASIGK